MAPQPRIEEKKDLEDQYRIQNEQEVEEDEVPEPLPQVNEVLLPDAADQQHQGNFHHPVFGIPIDTD